MKNPFNYYKEPENIDQARSNSSYWWYEGMGEPGEGVLQVHFNTFIREMKRESAKNIQQFS